MLFKHLQDDFEGLAKEAFALADSGIRRMPRNFLYDCGIYITRSRSHISECLANFVEAEVVAAWPESEL